VEISAATGIGHPSIGQTERPSGDMEGQSIDSRNVRPAQFSITIASTNSPILV
jgi:hypothetical protein